MSSVYKLINTFDKDDITILNEIYDHLPLAVVKRYYNLFYLDKKDLVNSKLNGEFEKKWDYIKNKINKISELAPYSFYFLEYKQDSFCRAHTDNDKQVGLTSVTLIKKSDDLTGGEAIGYLPHWKSKLEHFDINRYEKNDECNDGESVIPVIMKQEVGQTLVYPHNFRHSVSLVERGTRRVFICWFKK